MASRQVSINDFGLLIAYALPGFTALWGASFISPIVRAWFGTPRAGGPTIGGFLSLSVAAVAVGLTISTVRWLLIDTLHHATGLRPPKWDFALLRESADAFRVLVDAHYQFYQHNANMVVALAVVLVARRLSLGLLSAPVGWADVGLLALVAVFFLGSRDALWKYYTRAGQLLRAEEKGGKRRQMKRLAADALAVE